MKNSTEFAGDLTLCISYNKSVLLYRIRHLQHTGKFTVDNDDSFDEVFIVYTYIMILRIFPKFDQEFIFFPNILINR